MAKDTDIELRDVDPDELEEVDPTAESIEAKDPSGDPLTVQLTEQQVREHMMEAGYVDGEPPEVVEPLDEDEPV